MSICTYIMNNHAQLYEIYHNLRLRSDNSADNFSILKLCIVDDSLKSIYETKINKHNDAFLNNKFADSGFDLVVPNDVTFTESFESTFIDMGVKAELVHCDFHKHRLKTVPFYLYPRSSISKTPLMLANHTGIIDSGYRGNLIGAFRALHLPDNNQYTVAKHTRLLQLCHTNLSPIYVVIVNENELSSSERGNGGFGSTGK